jgi:hypothetical protein
MSELQKGRDWDAAETVLLDAGWTKKQIEALKSEEYDAGYYSCCDGYPEGETASE